MVQHVLNARGEAMHMAKSSGFSDRVKDRERERERGGGETKGEAEDKT
jgi:hypothetical protein